MIIFGNGTKYKDFILIKMHKKKIIFFDGPPACGKTTLTYIYSNLYKMHLCKYKRLCISNVLSTFLLKILNEKHSNVTFKEDPILKLCTKLHINAIRISYFIIITEICCKFLNILKILFLSLLLNRGIIVDEGPSLAFSNYLNLYRRYKCLLASHFYMLLRLEISMLLLLSKFFELTLIFIRRDLPVLRKLWSLRSTQIPYDVEFFIYSIICYRYLQLPSSVKFVVIKNFPVKVLNI